MEHNARNGNDMKKINQNAILRMLYQKNMSSAELSRVLGLTRASVSNHLGELTSDGLVMEVGTGESTRGRKPTLLDINPAYGYVAGLYLSRGTFIVGLTDMKGGVLKSAPVCARTDAVPKDMLDEAIRVLNTLIADVGVPGDKIIGMGVSVPGPVDTLSGVMLTPPGFEKWHNFPIVTTLSSMTGWKVFVENNAISLTLAELRYGHGREISNYIYIVVDSGIGGGLVIGGHIYRGKSKFGTELGHTSIKMDGRLCVCGNVGCLERYASIPALLAEVFSPNEGVHSWHQVVEAAEAGDERCLRVMDREANYLAIALVNFVNVLEPEAVIFGGHLLHHPARMTWLLHDRIQRHMIMRDIRDIKVLPSALRDDIEVRAAAALVLDDFLQIKE